MMSDEHHELDEALIHDAVHGNSAALERDALAQQLRLLRDELCRPPVAKARWNHVAAMRRAREAATRRRGARTTLAIAVATVGFVGATGGLAAAGRLGPAQEHAARIAEVVGVDLPGNDRPERAEPAVHAGASELVTRADGALAPAPVTGTTLPGAGGTPPGRSVSAPGIIDDTPDGSAPPANGGSAPAPTTGPATPPAPPPAAPPEEPPGANGNGPGHDPSGAGNSASAPGQTIRLVQPIATTNGNGNANANASPPGPSGSSGNSGSAPGRVPYNVPAPVAEDPDY
jgi:hypothetical protein